MAQTVWRVPQCRAKNGLFKAKITVYQTAYLFPKLLHASCSPITAKAAVATAVAVVVAAAVGVAACCRTSGSRAGYQQRLGVVVKGQVLPVFGEILAWSTEKR